MNDLTSCPMVREAAHARGRSQAEAGDIPASTVLERVPYDPQGWDAIVARHPDAEVYHTAAWLEFLARTQHAEPVIAVVRADGRPRGHFVGAIVKRYGVRILGSPLRGWTTQCMGFLLDEGVDRRAAAEALLPFAFHDLGCLHVELADRQLDEAAMADSAFTIESGTTYRLDLTPAEDDLLACFHRTTRKEIRKAIRSGLTVEAGGGPGFAEELYGYVQDTFARQRLAPTYDLDRVRALLECLQPDGLVHQLRVRTPDGASIATSISVGRGRTAIGWGMGFDRTAAEFHPMELLWWETIRSWRNAGTTTFDLAGGGEYKAKYGAGQTPTSRFYRSRWPLLERGRDLVRRLVRVRQAILAPRTAKGAGRGTATRRHDTGVGT